MTDTPAHGAPLPALHATVARRRSAGIYGTIVASAVLAAGGSHLRTVALAVAVLVTLLVYWAAEGYAELLGEHAHSGRLPSWSHVRASLAGKASQLRGVRLLAVTLIAGAFGVMMILLKLFVTH
jgi:hypothetical protein